jgi:N-acetylmuramoyl-L-alanine amidase
MKGFGLLFASQSAARPAGRRKLPRLRFLPLVLLALILSAGSAEEKRIAIYGASTNYSLPVVDRNGHEYVGLLEIVEPLGTVNARTDGLHWRLRYNDVEADFTNGQTRAKIHGKDFDLSSTFLLEGGRGLVPIPSLYALLTKILSVPVSLNEASRRLFIGNVATHFTAQLNRTTPLRLVMNFTAPVNPTIATEPGKLRMVFHREPIVPPSSPTLTFDDKTIPSATYFENNGTAEIDVNSSAPLMASFSNDGHTITITAAISQSNAALPGTPLPPSPATPANPAAVIAPIPTTQLAPRHFFAVLDASHGGDDPGVALASNLLEKDVTLSLTRRLRQELESRGISTLLLRDTDGGLTLDQRAIFSNTAHPVIYIAMHAAADGKGVRLYTALLPAGGENNGPFVAWNTAQTLFLPASQLAAQRVAAELQRRQIQVRTLSAPLRPLNNVTAAAIAVEVAPPNTDVKDLALPGYQQNVVSALANGIVSVRDRLGAAR